jgi:hypothetical protein
MTELLKIETYNDGANTVHVAFRKLHVDYTDSATPWISVICDELHTGPAGTFTVPFSMYATNAIRVPVYQVVDGATLPVMIEQTPGLVEGDEGYLPPVQQTIG